MKIFKIYEDVRPALSLCSNVKRIALRISLSYATTSSPRFLVVRIWGKHFIQKQETFLMQTKVVNTVMSGTVRDYKRVNFVWHHRRKGRAPEGLQTIFKTVSRDMQCLCHDVSLPLCRDVYFSFLFVMLCREFVLKVTTMSIEPCHIVSWPTLNLCFQWLWTMLCMLSCPFIWY